MISNLVNHKKMNCSDNQSFFKQKLQIFTGPILSNVKVCCLS